MVQGKQIMSMETVGIILLKYFGPVFARMAFAKALGGSITPEDVAESLSELGPFTDRIEAITGDYRAATRGRRLFEEAGEIAAENLVELFEREGDGLAEERIEPIVQDAANLLEKNGLRLLIDAQYDSTRFIKAVGDIPIKHLHLDSDEVVFMRRLLQDSGRILFTIAEKLPHFERENAARLLQNDAQILQDVREALAILKRMEAVSQQNNPEEKAANFERDYRRLLADDLDRLKLFGIPQIDSYYQPLTMAFVQVNAVKRELLEQNGPVNVILDTSLIDDEPSQGFSDFFEGLFGGRTVWESATELMAEARRMVIVGSAGAGKTTLLKWMVVRAARQDEAMPEQWRGKIPFYVRVRDYTDKPLPRHYELPVQFGQSKNLQGDVPEGWVDRQLRSGRGLVLLDGLDEVRAEKRAEVFESLNGLLTRYEKATYVISTRPATLEDETTRRRLQGWGFEQLRLRDMEPEQIELFITQWHTALGDEACSLPQVEKAGLPQLAAKLRRMVAVQAQLQDLARNPLLCAMLCALHHRYKRELPQNRVRLYQLCLETLLDGRDAERGVDTRDYELALARIPQVQPYLGRVAYWMMRHDQSVIGREELGRQLQLPDDEAVTTQLVNYLVERSALLQEQAKDEFDFVHRSFLEYLAAERLVHDGDATVESVGERAKEKRWRDTLRLVAGLGNEQDKKNLLDAIIQLSEKERWAASFALECYEWMVAPSQALQEKMQKHMVTLEKRGLIFLGGAGITTLSILSPLAHLKTLVLNDTAFSDTGLSHLALLTNLQELFLSNTAVSDVGLSHLAQLTHLQVLDLSGTTVSNAGLTHLTPFTNLQTLDLSDTAVSDTGLSHLAPLTNLQELFLSNTVVSDAGPPQLAQLTHLQVLNLSNTAISDAGLPHLAQLTNLLWLVLDNTAVSDIGLLHLAPLINLHYLYLSGTAVTPAAIKKFKQNHPREIIIHH